MSVVRTRDGKRSTSGPWYTAALLAGFVASVFMTRRRDQEPAVAPSTATDPSPAVPRHGARDRWITVGIGVCIVIAVATAGLSLAADDAAEAVGGRVAVGEIPGSPGAPAVGVVQSGPPPVSIALPAIRVESELEDLRLSVDGILGVPRDAARAGWWSQGVAPGDPGPAVIVGHVDSYDGPGVFLLLHRLQPGDEAVVRRNDGTSVTFVVDAVHQFEKDRFPSDIVYGATAEPTLRLITCGGTFDKKTRSYTDNVVVFAHLKTEPPA